jgi:peptidoglycan hydrolase-like protein with peptidoglycan-binding domain
MKRLFLFPIVLVLALSSLALADDQIQAVQQALKDKGFYYGTVDGEPGPETDAAIRRYQIRQGLEVTGKLDTATLSSLNLAANAQHNNTVQAVPPPTDQSSNVQPAEAQTPPPEVVQSDHDILRNPNPPQAAAPAPAPDDQQAPEQPGPAEQAPPPPQPAQPYAGQSVSPEYAQFFRKTPYETAPAVVQRSTVQRAQERLARQGFYRGMADGELSNRLSRALAAYQQYAELRATGRLDMDTLADMNLLPRRHVFAPPPMPYGYAEPGPVYRGIWVH